jgi:hypothetical protein
MTVRELIVAFVSSVIGGLIVLLVEQLTSSRRERTREDKLRRVRDSNADRIITDDIFQSLGPSNSVALMRQMLGVPNKYRKEELAVLSDRMTETNSYLYMFKNAMVKITSKDNETIDTLTVICSDNSLSVSGLIFPCESKDLRFGKVTVCPELLENSDCTFLQTRIDASFAISWTNAAPIYLTYTYFGFAERGFEFHKNNDAKVFLGGTIDGVCISNMGEDGYYIYYSELVMTGTLLLSE